MTVEDLIKQLQNHDPKKRVVVSDVDGAGKKAADIEFIDQRVEKGASVVAIWVHV